MSGGRFLLTHKVSGYKMYMSYSDPYENNALSAWLEMLNVMQIMSNSLSKSN